MGPPPFGGGEFVTRVYLAVHRLMLQWGRRLSAAESAIERQA
ncbi:hypothetical protein WME98_25975 [Sorangium sp. So ce296]